ncbi:hypothetical protein FA95DRAFT_822753 [Auriscalpium vulgare]|uniref:Uncharacterized protein n=1 Tax=Auriscalpium vulgare TaxID=40419 RepID=A0ACB8S0S8_9AGAM|nr:hypothetical protein FA95DRAFT_822753 [Auriscalpium vulgare]
MTMNLSFSGAEIVALCLESVFFGIYIVLFIACLQVLFRRRTESGLNVPLVIVCFALVVLITWHQVIDAVRLVLAFKGNQSANQADEYYAHVTATLGVMKTAVYFVETMVSDVFILYRCYIVWNRRWIVIALPVLLYVADCGTGIASLYTMSLISTDVIFNDKQEQVTNSFFSCTLALNAVCTGLIAFRIWWTQRQNMATKVSSNLSHVTMILIESGSIYLATLILLVATYSAHSVIFNIFLDLTSPVIGVVFSLIIVRVGLGMSSDAPRPAVTRSISFPLASHRPGMRTGTTSAFRTSSSKGSPTARMSGVALSDLSGLQGSYKMEEMEDVEQASLREVTTVRVYCERTQRVD